MGVGGLMLANRNGRDPSGLAPGPLPGPVGRGSGACLARALHRYALRTLTLLTAISLSGEV